MAWGRGKSRSRASPLDDAALRSRLRPGERLLAAADVVGEPDGDGVVGGTARALYLPDDVVLGWHEIDQASWHQDEFRLDVVTLAIDEPARSYQLTLREPGRLPELVRERVTSSIVVNEHVSIVGRRGAKIIARRLPGTEDLDWVVVYDPRVDGSDPEVKRAVHDAVAVLRRDLGV